jgi:CheY-like chemotaxis protein
MKTILVIDDERSIAAMVAEVLEGEGYRVVVAHDGEEGYQRLAHQPIDLIVSDVMMPRMDGRVLAERLQRDAAYAHIPIILMSAGLEHHSQLDYADDRFLKKPFTLHTLLAMIEAHLR